MSNGNPHNGGQEHAAHPDHVRHAHVPEARGMGVPRSVVAGIVAAGALGLSFAGIGVESVVDRYQRNSQHPGWDVGGISKPTAPAPRSPIDTSPIPEHLAKPGPDKQLQHLKAYEKQYGYNFSSNMLTADVPHNPAEAQKQAKAMVGRLQNYKQQGIEPIVLMTATEGNKSLDLKTLNDSKHTEGYTSAIGEYFTYIKDAGITDDEMGTWFPLPAPNVSSANKNGVTDPELFQRNAVPIMQTIQEHFRGAHIGVFVDAQAPAEDYVYGLPDGLIDTIGLQGFPDSPSANPANYLPVDNAVAIGNRTGATRVLINTGTAASYRQHDGSSVDSDVTARGTQMYGVLKTQTDSLTNHGFNVVDVNFVVEDDSSAGGSDWGYHSSADTQLMGAALTDSATAGVPVSFYDNSSLKSK